jgi:AcrR family transcriptional regulator
MEVTSTVALTASERLLVAADQVFYAEGIHNVPVDRVIAEARVTRATFYHHFPGKEDLVVAYLKRRDEQIRAAAARAADASSGPRDLLAAFVQGIIDDTCRPGFRGCPFINAAAEYPDPEHPVRIVIAEHRRWFHDALVNLATALQHPDPQGAADGLAMLRDGAMVAGYLNDADHLGKRLTSAMNDILG